MICRFQAACTPQQSPVTQTAFPDQRMQLLHWGENSLVILLATVTASWL